MTMCSASGVNMTSHGNHIFKICLLDTTYAVIQRVAGGKLCLCPKNRSTRLKNIPLITHWLSWKNVSRAKNDVWTLKVVKLISRATESYCNQVKLYREKELRRNEFF